MGQVIMFSGHKLSQNSLAILLSGTLGILFAILPYLIYFSPASINTTEHGGQVFFQVDRKTVLTTGNCVAVRWRVDNIVRVHINGAPTIGSGEQLVCIGDADSRQTLRVDFKDGSTRDYQLQIGVFIAQPLGWGLFFLLTVCSVVFFLRIFPLLSQQTRRLGERKFLVKLIKGSLCAVIGILVAGVLLEIGLRVYFTNFGTLRERMMYTYSREELRNLESIVAQAPYVNYIPSPDYPGHNSMGYRGPEIELPKPEGVFRIVALGGSTTYGQALLAEMTYPAQLQQILRQQYDYQNVEVINAGFQGYTSWELLVTLAFRVLELEPDMIIIYAATNDTVPREHLSGDCYRGHNALRGLNGARGFWVEPNTPLSLSVLHRLVGINVGWLSNPIEFESSFVLPKLPCAGDEPGTTVDDRVAGNIPVYFERNIRNLIALAQANNVQPVLSTWAYQEDADRPAYWRQEIAEHNTIIRNLAMEMNTALYELDESFPPGNNLWMEDGVHFSEAGAHEQARQYAAFLDTEQLIPEPDNND